MSELRNNLNPKHIMVIDDHKMSAEMLGLLLQQLGYITSVHFNALDALNTLKDFRPKYIFLDLKMPDLDGFDALKKIRQYIGNKEIIIIALTGASGDYDQIITSKSGFNHHLAKPIDIDLLNAILEKN